MTATITTTDKSYMGVGKIWGRLHGSTGVFWHLGNSSKLGVKTKLKTISIKDYTRSGGGTRRKIQRVDSIDISITCLEMISQNLALAVSGTLTEEAGATVSSETKTISKGGLIVLDNPVSAVTSVKQGTTTFASGTDYIPTSSGLLIPDDSTIPNATVCEIAYTQPGYDQVDAATQLSTEMELFFEGLNDADEDMLPVHAQFWRVQMPPVDELQLIASGDSAAEFSFSAEALKDDTRTGAGVSAFYRVRKVKLAA